MVDESFWLWKFSSWQSGTKEAQIEFLCFTGKKAEAIVAFDPFTLCHISFVFMKVEPVVPSVRRPIDPSAISSPGSRRTLQPGVPPRRRPGLRKLKSLTCRTNWRWRERHESRLKNSAKTWQRSWKPSRRSSKTRWTQRLRSKSWGKIQDGDAQNVEGADLKLKR